MSFNLLSVDLEDWYHFMGDPGAPAYEQWPAYESRVEKTTDVLLDILEGKRITFFVLGYIAKQHPELIRKIASAGHEIACHGDKHDFVFKQGPDKFRDDIASAKAVLEDITGVRCSGYRAPGFSIREQDRWALEIIKEEGFEYDSSIFPAMRTSGGIAGFYPYPQKINLKSGQLVELPVSTSKVLGVTTAFCGGGFFRFFPESYIVNGIKKINAIGQPAITYIHPRDLDYDQPKLPLKPVNRFMFYFGLKKAQAKFKRLVGGYEWGAFDDFVRRSNSLPVTEF